jgi:hypothetical protein
MTARVVVVCIALAVAWRRPFAWRVVRDTGVHRYLEHPSGRRRIDRVRLGHQPIDRHWLATGEWSPGRGAVPGDRARSRRSCTITGSTRDG